MSITIPIRFLISSFWIRLINVSLHGLRQNHGFQFCSFVNSVSSHTAAQYNETKYPQSSFCETLNRLSQSWNNIYVSFSFWLFRAWSFFARFCCDVTMPDQLVFICRLIATISLFVCWPILCKHKMSAPCKYLTNMKVWFRVTHVHETDYRHTYVSV